MGFTRKQGWRGLASAAFAAAVLALTATASANAQSPGVRSAATGSSSVASNSVAASTKGGTMTVSTVTCNWTFNLDSVDNPSKRDHISIQVRCTGGFADKITVNVAYLDMNQKTLRTEAASDYLFASSATRSTSSANDNEKWVYACVQATKGASSHETCGMMALAFMPSRATQLVDANSRLCVGIAGGSSNLNAPVVQFKCISHEDQGWYLPWQAGSSVQNLKGTQGFIKNFGARNRCLGTASGMTGDSTKIVSKACNAQNRDEIWLPVSAARWGYPGFYVLENAKAGLGSCLGVPSGSTAGSVQLVLYHCNGHPDQMWGRGPEYTHS
ncbi:RICIN domain-containing protein (plasmid) [Streptomyces sp. NBC_01384]|uniref:RICIN domain-containing protein n=1 Tax=Streptomyces sp. NBC_01384 TaxID=2903847 RepID=UPI002F90CD09